MDKANKYLKSECENHKTENRNSKETLNSQLSTLNSNDDRVVFVPAEEIRAFESIYVKMEQAQREFRKVAEELRNNGWAIADCQ